MRKVSIILLLLLMMSGAAIRASAFTSFYVFGDGVCSMTNGPGGSFYYKGTFSNGRVWVEVLAQRQGLVCQSNQNWSYYGHYSSNLVVNLNSFTPPADSSNALYVVWVCDADLVRNVNDYGTDLAKWTNSINSSLSNHHRIITNMYHAKGARHIVMPNAVDLGKIPLFVNNSPANKAFIRSQTTNFNNRFATLITNTAATLPGLKIYSPDVFTLLDKITGQPASYGLQKPTTYVIDDLDPSQWGLNGPGTNYVFWDDLNPTAMTHEILADSVHEMIFPPRISRVTNLGGSNQLLTVNVPVGLGGFVEGSANLGGWSPLLSFTNSTSTMTNLIPASGPMQFYRLRFPFSWSWP